MKFSTTLIYSAIFALSAALPQESSQESSLVSCPSDFGVVEFYNTRRKGEGYVCGYCLNEEAFDSLKGNSKSGPCKDANDKIRSAIFRNVKAGTQLAFFVNSGTKYAASVSFLNNMTYMFFNSFNDNNIVTADYKFANKLKNRLTGKFSHISIRLH